MWVQSKYSRRVGLNRSYIITGTQALPLPALVLLSIATWLRLGYNGRPPLTMKRRRDYNEDDDRGPPRRKRSASKVTKETQDTTEEDNANRPRPSDARYRVPVSLRGIDAALVGTIIMQEKIVAYATSLGSVVPSMAYQIHSWHCKCQTRIDRHKLVWFHGRHTGAGRHHHRYTCILIIPIVGQAGHSLHIQLQYSYAYPSHRTSCRRRPVPPSPSLMPQGVQWRNDRPENGVAEASRISHTPSIRVEPPVRPIYHTPRSKSRPTI